jgi:uncharacterized YccA/Bax inhibitor family protein
MTTLTRSANPALNKNTFSRFAQAEGVDTMTIQGTVNKVAIMLLLLLGGAWYTWRMAYEALQTDPAMASGAVMPWIIGGGIGGFIVAIVTIFKRSWAGITGPIYAVLEGLFLGGISAFFEARYPGIVIQAVGLTFAILFTLLFAYKSRIIKPTQNFRLGVFAATGGVMMLYIVSFLLNLFGVPVGYLHDSSPLSIGISIVIVIIASLNLVLDFDFIEHGAGTNAPKYMEWYAAFGLMVTLIWLYIEILHLLSKFASRD